MEKVIKIIIADGEYMETYGPIPRDPKEAEEKVKRGILKSKGMLPEEIDKVIGNLDLEFVNGIDGRFDDGPYTPVRIVRKIHREPPIIEIVNPISEEQQEISIPKQPKENKKIRQTMLQQFYGDKDAEKRRIKTFARFKSHVVKKPIEVYDEDGNKRKVEVYTIEDYERRLQDADELLLNGYQTRLERLSRAHQRDFSPYKREIYRLKMTAIQEIIEIYEEMHKANPQNAEKFKAKAMQAMSSFENPEFEKKAVQALIDSDTEFIETNNYTYNSRQNTAENLKTLGKAGEKSVKAQVSKEQSVFQKAGLHTMNVLIEIRNHVKVPVNKAIGTYIASPIFRALFRCYTIKK